MRLQPLIRTRERRKHSLLWYFTFAVLIIYGIDLLTGGFVREHTRTITGDITMTGGSVVSAIGESGFFSTSYHLAQQNASLESELSEYRSKDANYLALSQEVSDLSAVAHLADSQKGIAARVISSFRASPYGTFIVLAGKSSGVVTGSIVLSADGYVVGTITDVHQNTSVVRELFSPQSTIDVVAHKVSFSVQGTGGGNAVGHISRSLEVATNDVVFSPHYLDKPVGVVGSIASDPSNAVQIVYLRTPTSLETLQLVYIVERPAETP